MKLKKLLWSVLGLALAASSLAFTSGQAQAASEWEPSNGYHWYPTVVTVTGPYGNESSARTYTKPGLFMGGTFDTRPYQGYTLPVGSQWKVEGYYSGNGGVSYDLGDGYWLYGKQANIPVNTAADAILSVLAKNGDYQNQNYQHIYGGQWDPFISGYWGGPYVAITSNVGKYVVYQDGSTHPVFFLY